MAWELTCLELLSCKQQVVGSNPTQSQCNFSSEVLHRVSHGVVCAKCQHFILLAHSDIISWLLSPPRLSGEPYWYFTLSSSKILISPVASLKWICQLNLEVVLRSMSVNWVVQENIRGSTTPHVTALTD